MGRMLKKHKKIIEWQMTLKYKCPVTGEMVEPYTPEQIINEMSSYEQECSICGSHGSITLYLNKCKSCGKYHDSIEIDSW